MNIATFLAIQETMTWGEGTPPTHPLPFVHYTRQLAFNLMKQRKSLYEKDNSKEGAGGPVVVSLHVSSQVANNPNKVCPDNTFLLGIHICNLTFIKLLLFFVM